MYSITDRQKSILKIIVEDYIKTGNPVGSKTLIRDHNLKVSSATIRSEMNKLESIGYLEKAHTSSGRIPSVLGYKLFANELAESKNTNVENALKEIFSKRHVSIDLTLDEAAKSISEIAGLTLVTMSSEIDELLKSIQLTPLNDKMATIVLVTSSGRVESKLIEFSNYIKIEDVRIAVRLFKERLIDTPLRQLSSKVDALSSILSETIKNYEELIQVFIKKVFDHHNKVHNKIYGNDNIIKSEDIKRKDLANLMSLMESNSIFETIEGGIDEEENMKIEVRPNNTSIISKKIKTIEGSKEISILGSNRMEYGEIKKILKNLESLLKGDK